MHIYDYAPSFSGEDFNPIPYYTGIIFEGFVSALGDLSLARTRWKEKERENVRTFKHCVIFSRTFDASSQLFPNLPPGYH